MWLQSTADDVIVRAADNISLQLQAGEYGVEIAGYGAFNLYYDNSAKLETASSGVSVTGKLATTGDIDSGTGYYQITSGTTRFSLTHDGANCYLENQIGSFYVKTVDNTNTFEISNSTVRLPQDSDKLTFGVGSDLCNFFLYIFYRGNIDQDFY